MREICFWIFCVVLILIWFACMISLGGGWEMFSKRKKD